MTTFRCWCSRCYGTADSGHQEACPIKPNPMVEEMEKLAKDLKEKRMSLVPKDATERKKLPVTSGVLDYFPLALLEVAHVSKVGNDQHNPGEPLHWARDKSTDHADCILRHLIDRGKIDADLVRHSAKLAWRALALLQEELEDEVSERDV